jgi:hypothetical protein
MKVSTYKRLKAAEVPHAVPLIAMPKTSGVMPSGERVVSRKIDIRQPALQNRRMPCLDSHSTAYMAVPARLISIELTRTAHSATTAVKANIARAVASVNIARLRLLPRNDSIDHAPIWERFRQCLSW